MLSWPMFSMLFPSRVQCKEKAGSLPDLCQLAEKQEKICHILKIFFTIRQIRQTPAV